MAVDEKLLEILVCPEDKSKLTLADQGMVEQLNQRIEKGELLNRAGKPVEGTLDGGLIRADNRFLYPIREDIPVMLIDEAIPLTEE